MSELQVSLDDRSGALTVRMCRHEARNSLTFEMAGEIASTLRNVGPDVRCVVISSEGTVFCAGIDLKLVRPLLGRPETPELLRTRIYGNVQELIRSIWACPVPVIARLQGPALGVGADMALACDVRIASVAAGLEETWIHLGAVSALGGAFVLRNLIGRGRALDVLLTGTRLDSGTCSDLGLFEKVVAPDELDATVDAYTAMLGERDADAVRATVDLVRDQELRDSVDRALERALEHQLRLMTRPLASDLNAQKVAGFSQNAR
jgi:2-(1,2-epoxy-1,2-dihydrophenyl)acetyl-CoA isomerase